MIVESITVEGMYIISLAFSATEKWKAAGNTFSPGSQAEVWLTVLAVVALIISEVLLFYVFSKYRRSEQQLNQKITDLTVANVELRREKEKSDESNERLKQDLEELTATNEKLRQVSAQLTQSA